MCMVAVKQSGWNLRFVREQTPEICLSAVNKTPDAIQYVKDKSMLKDIPKLETNK